VQAENPVVEVLDPEGRPCARRERRVVLTTLHTSPCHDPLRLGDTPVGAPCDRGRGLPVLRRIHGRQRNTLRTPDSREFRQAAFLLWLDVVPLGSSRSSEEHRAARINYVMARTRRWMNSRGWPPR
jgi:phenylacetate-CoA ligase